MSNKLSRMQGTSAFIETHYESIAYCHHEKEVCHYCKLKICRNLNSSTYGMSCIGYNKCPEFTSEARYMSLHYEKDKRKKVNSKNRKSKTKTDKTVKKKCKTSNQKKKA